jgi:asparagine synthetase B (glutamine-hydrolysing)
MPQGCQIDLINVVFQNSKHPNAIPPDRETALACIEKDLRRGRPLDRWNWVPISIATEELMEKKDHICSLMAPCNTQMDWSIAAPFWFSSRGAPPETKILLCGFGADEIFGGYVRHRVQYEKEGWSGLASELGKDLERMWIRNLGRDDRMISDNGRETRCPFLDECLLRTVLHEIPLHERVPQSPEFIRGYSDKRLLRQLAQECLGLSYASTLPKRAIQFGSRSAKALSSGNKGHDIFEDCIVE